MVLTVKVECTHCKVVGKGVPAEFQVFNHSSNVYMPKGWVAFSKDRHLCKKCVNAYHKRSEDFFK